VDLEWRKLEKSRLADYKAPGGKLVRIRLKEEQGQIRSVQITGDFFLVPEESLGKLEKMLEEVPLREAELRLLVDRFFRGTEAQGLGVSPDDFVKAILSAKETI
jgi:lipoate-protein ligase A